MNESLQQDSFPLPFTVKGFQFMASVILSSDLDLIDELRLRCWARENYVPAPQRDTAWHPIILEEMSRKDGEASSVVLAG